MYNYIKFTTIVFCTCLFIIFNPSVMCTITNNECDVTFKKLGIHTLLFTMVTASMMYYYIGSVETNSTRKGKDYTVNKIC